MIFYFGFITYLLAAQNVDHKDGSLISNIMQKMAPKTKSGLPKGTKYFIKKNQLIKSTGIELEEDGQMIKLHPDLNGTQADLFPEYPLSMALQDIQLEIYLNSNVSTQWSSRGQAQFCIRNSCSPTLIDESNGFRGNLTGVSSQELLGSLTPYFDSVIPKVNISEIVVYGSLMEVYDIETVILGKIRFREKDDCRFSVRIQRVEEPEVSESQMFFNSDMKIKFSCLGSRPVLAVRDFVNTSLPRFSELERIKDYSLLMNQNSSLVIMTYTFRKKCLIKTEEFKCDIDALPEPDLSIAFWTESDRDFKEPTIELKIGPVITEVVSKNVSELSEELFLPFSDRAVASAIIMNLNSFNLTKTNRIVYSPQTNDFEAYFGSNVANSCMAVGGIQICDWTGSVKMFNYGQMESKCSLITITGKGKTAMDFKTIGDVRIDIDQDCKLEHKSNYRISIKIDKTMLKKLLESVVSNLRIDDQFMNVFNLKKLYETNILISERQSFNLAEFLSDRFPYVIKGSTNIPNTNYSVPFSLNIMANSFTGVDFQNLCMFLDKISTISLISRMTSLKEENLPAMLQDSSLCIQNLPNASSSKNAVLLSLPISILSKCMNSDLLCSFLNFVIGEKWRGMVLSGILQENTLNLKSPIVPEGKEFSRLNLTSCGVNYKLKMKQKIRVYMKCNLNLPEIELPVPIYFFPEFRKEKFLVYGFVHYKAQESSTFFGLEHFKYTHLHTKFLLKDIEFINFEVEVYYTELGLSTKTPAPTVFMEVNLVNQNYSQIHVRLPPLSIIEIGKIFGFGDCSDLSDLITDTLDEWDIKEFKLETLSGGPLIIKGLNLAHNTLFNSTLQIHKKLDDSKIILHALKPIILRIKSIEHQATLASYTNSKEGPTIVINMECACENRCKENRMGALVSTISVLNMKSSIKIDLTYSKPWTGLIVTNNFMNQKLKARLQIELSSLDTEIELTGTLLNEEKQIVNRIQGSILKKSKHVIDKVAFMEKELDNILLVLNKIRSEKIDTQLKLEESRKRLEQDTVTEIVYETSLNLTCREEYCERVCVGCASTLPCVSKDILGSCVSFSNWDTKCGCGRDHLCLLYNDACEEIIELSKSQLRIYDNTKVFQKMLYDSYHKKFQQISKDEAKIEMLYSSAMKITAKTMKEMKKKINEARAVFKDIPISKWLTVSDILIFSNPNITALDKKLQNQTNELCIYLQLTFNNRKNIVQTKYVNYCPSKHGTLIKFIISEISKELFPNIYNIDEDNSQFSNDILNLDKNFYFESIKANQTLEDNLKTPVRMQFLRSKRSNSKEIGVKTIIHRKNQQGTIRQTLPVIKLVDLGHKDENEMVEDHWMIPQSTKGRCRVFVHVIDIINDLLNTINQIRKYQNKTLESFQKQKEKILLNEDYYYDKLKDAGELLGLTNSEYNASFFNILAGFSRGSKLYLQNMQESIDNVEHNVWKEWKAKLSERIVKMGGIGLERFTKNLNDVIKILLRPKVTHSIFSKIHRQNTNVILSIVKEIERLILTNESKHKILVELSEGYKEIKRFKKLLKNTCNI